MPLPLPELDDRTYDALLAEALQRIPKIHPDWTDHNPSDAGVALLELFSWLTELSLYRVNQIPEENYRTFLQLLTDRPVDSLSDDIEVAIHDVISDLRAPYRAVTARDYEELAMLHWQAEGLPPVARATCVPRLNLAHPSAEKRFEPMAGHVSLVILPESTAPYPLPDKAMLDSLYDFFLPRRTLTTRHHVVAPEYMPFTVQADVVLHPDYLVERVEIVAGQHLFQYLHPIIGGDDGKGWEFGRNVFISELIQILDSTDGVDYVQNVQIVPRYRHDYERLFTYPQKPERLIGLKLAPIELPALLDLNLHQQSGGFDG